MTTLIALTVLLSGPPKNVPPDFPRFDHHICGAKRRGERHSRCLIGA
jgi:hypothetical protein